MSLTRRLLSRAALTAALLHLVSAWQSTIPAFGEETGSIAGKLTPSHAHDFVLSIVRIPDLALEFLF